MTIEKLEIKDPTGVFSNINDLLDEIRNDNIEALAIVYTRRDGSTRTFWSGWGHVTLVDILEQLKFDYLMARDEGATARTFGEEE